MKVIPMYYLIQPDPNDLATPTFLGFGAEWDSNSYIANALTEDDFTIIRQRVAWMRLPVARVMMQTKWCYRTEGQFTWDTPEMQALYRILDTCQELGTTVFLTDWGCEPAWLRVPGIASVADPQYAEAIGAYLDYLLRQRGYSCIRYFIMVNEPNLEVKEWARWKQGIENLWAVLQQRGLDQELKLVGSDESNGELWHNRAVNELQHILGAYDIHRYAEDALVRSGQLDKFFRAQWEYTRQYDPLAAGKPCIVGEAGMQDNAQHPVGNHNINQFWYGVFMADYAIQAVNAGSAAVSAWMLDDNAHKDFFWGLWSDKSHGMVLRPWFYSWGLLSRLFPAGSVMFRLPQPADGPRALVAQLPAGGWSIAVVNRGSQPADVHLQIPVDGPFTLRRYEYTEGALLADANGFPLPVETQAAFPQAISITCPANAVIFLTTCD